MDCQSGDLVQRLYSCPIAGMIEGSMYLVSKISEGSIAICIEGCGGTTFTRKYFKVVTPAERVTPFLRALYGQN